MVTLIRCYISLDVEQEMMMSVPCVDPLLITVLSFG